MMFRSFFKAFSSLVPAQSTRLCTPRPRALSRSTWSVSPPKTTSWQPAVSQKGLYGLMITRRSLPNAFQPRNVSRLADRRLLHATPRREAACFPLLWFLKISSSMPLASMVCRVTLTFVPVFILKRFRMRHQRPRSLEERAALAPRPYAETRTAYFLHVIRIHAFLFHMLWLIPFALMGLTMLASLERVPLTGRWRMMLLSPEEESNIAAQLAGVGWYRAVAEILSQSGTTTIVDPADWRYNWVFSTLRRLEAAIPVLQCEKELAGDWMDSEDGGVPRPPPAVIPLYHRPTESKPFLRFKDAVVEHRMFAPEDPVAGPPYSLLVVERHESSNAFSYGFGADGAGGIVVFTGFLDDVVAKFPFPAPDDGGASAGRTSWLSGLFGGLFAASVSGVRAPPEPTEEQTSELAILLAHELAHLLLSHHIETLSSGSIVGPGVMSIVTDVVRTMLFPVTMMLGPFINDALAGVGKASSGEFAKLSEYRTSQKQEIEADIVSARLLAHAGFDPRQAVRFWEGRQETPEISDCSPSPAEVFYREDLLPRSWRGTAHPMNFIRVQKLKEELERWEKARRKAREERERVTRLF